MRILNTSVEHIPILTCTERLPGGLAVAIQIYKTFLNPLESYTSLAILDGEFLKSITPELKIVLQHGLQEIKKDLDDLSRYLDSLNIITPQVSSSELTIK